MYGASKALLFLFIAWCRSSNEYFTAVGATSNFEQHRHLGNKILTPFSVYIPSRWRSVQTFLVTDFDSGGHRLAEIFEDETTNYVVNCNLFGDENLIRMILEANPAVEVRNVTIEEMDQFTNVCTNRSPQTVGSSLSDILDGIQLLAIFPGTKWCGAGNVSKNYDDLGLAVGTDRCCRDHDYSDDTIGAFHTEHNITNYKPYTMTDCADDRKFYDCLMNDSSTKSIAVGTVFFDILKTQCFEYDYPTKCTERDFWRLPKQPCEHVEPDTSQQKDWHVVNDPSFIQGLIQKETRRVLASLFVPKRNGLGAWRYLL